MKAFPVLALALSILSLASTAYLASSLGLLQLGSARSDIFQSHNDTPESAVLDHYKHRWNNVAQFDVVVFWKNHLAEIQETMAIAETLMADDIAVALVRYSIGGNVYRDGVWLRRMDGQWYVSINQYYSTLIENDPFKDGKPERAKQIIEKVEKWKKESAPKWW